MLSALYRYNTKRHVFKCPRQIHLLHYILCISFHFPKMHLSDYFLWADLYFSLIHVVLFIGALMLIWFSIAHTDSTHVNIIIMFSKESPFLIHLPMLYSQKKVYGMHLGLFSVKTSSETAVLYETVCCISEYLRLSFFTVWMLYYFLFSPKSALFNSRQTQGALNESDDPETGCLTDNKPTSRHFYPVALLLVSSHLLVVWLILSLALLLAKYQ